MSILRDFKELSRKMRFLVIMLAIFTNIAFMFTIHNISTLYREKNQLKDELDSLRDYENFPIILPNANYLVIGYYNFEPNEKLYVLTQRLNLSQVYLLNISEMINEKAVQWFATGFKAIDTTEDFLYSYSNNIGNVSLIKIELWTSLTWRYSCLGIAGNPSDGICLETIKIYLNGSV